MTTEDSPVKRNYNWFPVQATEFLLIVIINGITIAAFARSRHLRKRCTYLIINLTVADLLVGAVTGPLLFFHTYKNYNGFTWPEFISCAIKFTFPIASQVNLSLLSLERLHATLFPFRHCLISKWIYFKIIIANWLITVLLSSLMAGLYLNESDALLYVLVTFGALTVLVLIVCYITIFVNVKGNPHSQHGGSIHTERKLSVTFMVTGISVLTILPWVIYESIPEDIKNKWHSASSVDIDDILAVIFYANSLVNPLVYAIRMQEFQKAFSILVSRQRQAARKRQRSAKQERALRSEHETRL